MITVSDLTERELIARIQALLPPAPDWLLVGIGDDGAVVEHERNHVQVLTVDAVVEGVHFDRRFTPPDAIGHRALAVNLSDLAAMGAAPRLALLSFALPQSLPCADYDALVSGIVTLASRHQLHVVGGNLTRSPGPLLIDITVAGAVKRRQVLTRRGARPGDEVYVSGSIGAAVAGLRILRNRLQPSPTTDRAHAAAATDACTRRYLYPEPRVRLGVLLARNRAATACMDVSDGLADAAHAVARASAVGMVIDATALPIEPGALDALAGPDADALDAALTGGDDYELFFTAGPRSRGRLKTVLRDAGVAVTRIGVCTSDPRVLLRRTVAGAVQDTPIPKGYSHFG
ncbi:MAG: thiamine-phosphate kinase [Acidobacteria bacterium]|nr:thiamine-phosphate kinase [Acidobacteriota bacterium]